MCCRSCSGLTHLPERTPTANRKPRRSTRPSMTHFYRPSEAAAPTKPILCVTPILNRADLDRGGNRNGERPELYREGITRVVRQRQNSDANLHLSDGLTMVNDPLFLLVTDRVHPNDAGMHRIANGVAQALKPLVGESALVSCLKKSGPRRSRLTAYVWGPWSTQDKSCAQAGVVSMRREKIRFAACGIAPTPTLCREITLPASSRTSIRR